VSHPPLTYSRYGKIRRPPLFPPGLNGYTSSNPTGGAIRPSLGTFPAHATSTAIRDTSFCRQT